MFFCGQMESRMDDDFSYVRGIDDQARFHIYIRSGTVIPSKLIPFLIVLAVNEESATRKV